MVAYDNLTNMLSHISLNLRDCGRLLSFLRIFGSPVEERDLSFSGVIVHTVYVSGQINLIWYFIWFASKWHKGVCHYAIATCNLFDSETIFVALLNFFTGIFAGFAVFGFLGYLAWKLGTSIDDVVDSGMLIQYYGQALRASWLIATQILSK